MDHKLQWRRKYITITEDYEQGCQYDNHTIYCKGKENIKRSLKVTNKGDSILIMTICYNEEKSI